MGAANACSPSARSPLRMLALIRGCPFRRLAVSLARRWALNSAPRLYCPAVAWGVCNESFFKVASCRSGFGSSCAGDLHWHNEGIRSRNALGRHLVVNGQQVPGELTLASIFCSQQSRRAGVRGLGAMRPGCTTRGCGSQGHPAGFRLCWDIHSDLTNEPVGMSCRCAARYRRWPSVNPPPRHLLRFSFFRRNFRPGNQLLTASPCDCTSLLPCAFLSLPASVALGFHPGCLGSARMEIP
ncbi:hypothetical protein B0H14DRAFT_865608 [Mycena olivaceomarginata]|nr:hypothetical protein B0H14DRAFT_865608 [Mycena olivaceomarginata]